MGTVFAVAAGSVIAALLLNYDKLCRDSTDAPGRGGRSGLTLYVDHGTGVEYVSTIMGGLTPRVDAQGRPMVRKP